MMDGLTGGGNILGVKDERSMVGNTEKTKERKKKNIEQININDAEKIYTKGRTIKNEKKKEKM